MAQRTRRLLRVAALAGVGGAVALVAGAAFFLTDSRSMVVAGHDAVVRPTLDDHAVIRTGPLLPDLRMGVSTPVGVDVELGATEISSPEELVQRYGFIASEPASQVDKVSAAVRDMAVSAALRGIAVGAVPVVVWLLVGRERRHQLYARLGTPSGAAAGAALLVLPLLVWQPWVDDSAPVGQAGAWVGLQEFLGPEVDLPDAVDAVEIRQSTTTDQTKRLVMSAVDTYEKSREFYDAAAEKAALLAGIRTPEEGETVALLVTDRHDNIGMDPVARAVGDRAGATVVLDGGDDTSTGQSWEEFSLDSLDAVFSDLDRYAVAGNHDNGTFVRDHLAAAGWVMPQAESVEGPGGGLLFGVDDPRSSGLGNWRDEVGTSFADVSEHVADLACASQQRISTMLVHDANLGRQALERGCVDLVVGGHTHVQAGPTEIVSEDGAVGYSLTNGTTGGAAYAIAIGSKPRRDAHVSLITYDDAGRPTGVQWVELKTNGVFEVSEWVAITPRAAGEEPVDEAPADDQPEDGGSSAGER
ncbi:MAG: metallophosphoesterase [Nocardioides sp.]|uniref:metallophosphoesterase n=1 Tax=Nocardioides sp. TaxID=35761 RepID=UPI003F0A27CC